MTNIPLGHTRIGVNTPAQGTGEVNYLTADECAAELRVPKMTIFRAIHTGELDAIRINGRTYRIPRQAWIDYLASNATGGTE